MKYGGSAEIDVEESGESVVVRIKDRGPGIPDDLKEEAFKPFRRVGVRAVDGTGLGLTVARGIVRSLGGEVLLTDRKGGGLNVTMVIPKHSPLPFVASETRVRQMVFGGTAEDHSALRAEGRICKKY